MWSRELNTTRGLQATPLVENGVMYTTGSWSVVYALDARTGSVRWMYDPAVPRTRAYFICCDVVNRGVACDGGMGWAVGDVQCAERRQDKAGIRSHADVRRRRQGDSDPARVYRTGPPTPAITMTASPEVIHDGRILYTAYCAQCHGLNAVAGPLPDLRYATRQVHEQFEAIVLGGARATLGMPPFKDLLKRAKEGSNPPAK